MIRGRSLRTMKRLNQRQQAQENLATKTLPPQLDHSSTLDRHAGSDHHRQTPKTLASADDNSRVGSSSA